ncbi:hypothetical protein TBLA_0A01810 [Henningerozyma blattae CBS 6284]|uniref:methylated diphthine methylhydrolase n=1 Tax=Henningerozyma blattae (strain ATCC 34711 / CBS 6284 / DSM 70876 / NBRC 10599 / NRRL Y-10934 / UCD 77-7) TaxID=1071380 RepID=I2GV29_HENB6|nr:hypothetical protein TBLA_0A01810 [Tetrapisispora blattae CBS 6284]CCH57981.1 hypothetical protein TBLA_0A01810 [Tetrapisispora blattae CBS 6284]
MEESNVLNAVKTNLPPCALRIVHDNFILIGTYNLDKPTGNRDGSLDIFDINLNLIHSYHTYGAILDLKVSPFDRNLIVTGHSTGNLILWKLDFIEETDDLIAKEIKSIQVFDKDTLITSLHFSPLDPTLLLITSTLGDSATINLETGNLENFNVKIIQDFYEKLDTNKPIEVQGSSQVVVVYRDKIESFDRSHDLECWTGEFGYLQPLQNVIFTGGDDSRIIAHDLRSKETIWSNNKIHQAGVVAIKCSNDNFRNNKPTSILTGSYDDHIRSLDLRMMGEMSIFPGDNISAMKVWETNLGGGVWRFSECPEPLKSSLKEGEDKLMVCCMYNGAKIVSLSDKFIDETGEYFQEVGYLKTGHESMCYGGDWSSEFIATCSFYDNSLQLWKE